MLLGIAFAFTACAHYNLVEPVKRDIGSTYSVEPQISWSRSTQDKLEIWTIDGPSLEAIHFFDGIGDGQTLFAGQETQKEKLPRFKKNMTASEVLELVADSIIAPGARSPIGPNLKGVGVRATRLRPYKFGNHPGFRFELSFLSKEGLEYEGFVVGAIKDDKLYLICYSGTRQYYYPKI
jgi:hypothetical protein